MGSDSPQFHTPILVIFWRRPETVLQLIARLRPLKPSRLFLACDGPRLGQSDEALEIENVRKKIEESIDWGCTVEKRYSEVNQGCKYGPANAISWFFSLVEEGIILEDDCLPEPSFFPFCRSLLERYRHDQRVWQISGNNFVPALAKQGGASYFFSGYSTTWGWASWRRCWQLYDIEMKAWPEIRDRGIVAHFFDSDNEIVYWTGLWNRLTEYDYPPAWDYQWIFSCFCNGALSIVPVVNLVSNIGFGNDGTNCLQENNPLANLPTQPLDSIVCEPVVCRNRDYDHAFFELVRFAEGKAPRDPFTRWRLQIYFTAKGIANKVFPAAKR